MLTKSLASNACLFSSSKFWIIKSWASYACLFSLIFSKFWIIGLISELKFFFAVFSFSFLFYSLFFQYQSSNIFMSGGIFRICPSILFKTKSKFIPTSHLLKNENFCFCFCFCFLIKNQILFSWGEFGLTQKKIV